MVILSSLSVKYEIEFNNISLLFEKSIGYIKYCELTCICAFVANVVFENAISFDLVLSSMFFVIIAAITLFPASWSLSILLWLDDCKSVR